ncbi:MAG: bacillithiol system redox-active protein YtxJ [Chitinophagaceae bacterium]|nr:bacillithiol system redox-active protein YtxJ [Chitinophagaceae bacterium]
MNWISLTTAEQLEEIKEKSKSTPQLIFKHSIRCGTSAMVKNRLDTGTAPSTIDFYYLDLINYRAISNQVADEFMVSHESPQILLISNGECVYDESHIGIKMRDIEQKASELIRQ